MKRPNRDEIKNNLEIIGKHIEKYRYMMLLLTILISFIAISLIIYWNYDEISAGEIQDILYLISHIVFLTLSVGIIVLLILNILKKIKPVSIAIASHVYSFILIVWATILSLMDLKLGLSPMSLYLAVTLISGLFVVEPIFFSIVAGSGFVTILIFQIFFNYPYFSNAFIVENVFNFIVFFLLIVLICFRNYRITIKDYKLSAALEKMSYYDALTGLLNERSYTDELENLQKSIEKGKADKFAIILMDVNNLKATNDAYGHRYGCHLIVRCGHMLPNYFPSSSIFHVGGDEFIVIVYEKDFEEFDQRIKKFDEDFTYSLIEYEGKELIFSVARGFSKYQKGDRYQDVLQRADNAMYENKKMLKEKYQMKSR